MSVASNFTNGNTADTIQAASLQLVPEPSRMMLFGLGLLSLFYRRRATAR